MERSVDEEGLVKCPLGLRSLILINLGRPLVSFELMLIHEGFEVGVANWIFVVKQINKLTKSVASPQVSAGM